MKTEIQNDGCLPRNCSEAASQERQRNFSALTRYGSSILLVTLLATLAGCTSDDADEDVYSYQPIDGGMTAYGDGCGPSDSLGRGSSRASGASHSAFTAYHPADGRLDPSGASCASGGKCDTTQSPSIHSDLRPLRSWVSGLSSLKQQLSPARCLAASAFAKTHDWFGETCLDRSADFLETWLRNCYENDWSENARTVAFDFQLLGHHDDGYYGSSNVMREYLRGHGDECEWSEAVRHRVLSPEVINEAVRFVRQPY